MKLGRLLVFAVALLPLQQAFAISSHGTPVAMSDLLFLLVAMANLSAWRARSLHQPTALLVGLLAASVGMSLLALAFRSEQPIWSPEKFRVSPGVDALISAGLLLLCLTVFRAIISTQDVPGTQRRLVDGYRFGMILAIGLWVYQVLSLRWSLLPGLPGSSPVVQTIFGIELPRNGPFAEGNYFGAFSFFGGILGLVAGRRSLVVLAMAGLLASEASASLVAFGALLILRLLARRPHLISAAVLVAALFGGSVTLIQQLPGVGKLVHYEVGLSQASSSQSERLALLEASVCEGKLHPLDGVGPGRFDQWFAFCAPMGTGPRLLTIRTTPNNFFAALWAEYGALGLALASALLVVVLTRTRGRDGKRPLWWPLWIVLFMLPLQALPAVGTRELWICLGFLVLAGAEARNAPGKSVESASRWRGWGAMAWEQETAGVGRRPV